MKDSSSEPRPACNQRPSVAHLGLLLPPGPAGEPEAGTILIVGPAALLHPAVPQPAGSLIPEREPGELVFVADLIVELRAWPQDTWAKVGVDPDQVTQAVLGCWQGEQVSGLQVDDLGLEEARSLTRPAMTYVRGQLRGRLTTRLARAHRRWLHPPVAVTPTTASRSHHTRRLTPEAAGCPRVSGTGTAWRTVAAESVPRGLRLDSAGFTGFGRGRAGRTSTIPSCLGRGLGL